MLDQEVAETFKKYHYATEKVNIAATDSDTDPSFTTRPYSSTAIGPDPVGEVNTFRGLVGFGEDRFVYEKRGTSKWR